MPPVDRRIPRGARSLLNATPLDELVNSYLDLTWNLDPAAATAAGVTEYDHRLALYDEESIRVHMAALQSVANSIEALEIESLDDEIDRTALLNKIRVTTHRFTKERTHERNPVFWLGHLLESLHLLLMFQDRSPEHAANALQRRLGEIPAFLDRARETLRAPPTVFLDTAAQVFAPGIELIDQVETHCTIAGEDASQEAEAARGALEAFAKHLEALRDGPTEAFAIGRDAFDFRLRFELAIRQVATEVWRYGWDLVEQIEAELAALAQSIDGSSAWKDVAERLRDHHPQAEELVRSYDLHMQRAKEFVVEHRLLDVPDTALNVVQTPPFLAPLIPFAAYQPPGTFSADQSGWFYVTVPGNGIGDSEKALRDHCHFDLPTTALHEGYPGHHLHFVRSNRLPRRVRAVLWSPIMVEGWALYCEEMMAEEGFLGDPRERLFQKVALLWRALRVVVDVGLHTRGMSVDEAVDLLVDRIGFDRGLALAEVRRYCAEPVYQASYALGRRELLRLRQSFLEAHGNGGQGKRAFHDAVLAYGGLPPSLARWGLGLGD